MRERRLFLARREPGLACGCPAPCGAAYWDERAVAWRCESCRRIVGDAPAPATPCPGCGEALALDVVLAHSCGYRRRDAEPN
jgi:hypothetical protein